MRPRLTLPAALLAALVVSCPSAAGAASSAPVAILGYLRQRLAGLDAAVGGARRALRALFGVRVAFFAAPCSRQDARVRAAVRRAGFVAAMTTRAGLVDAATDPFALGRVLVPSGRSPDALLRAVRTGG